MTDNSSAASAPAVVTVIQNGPDVGPDRFGPWLAPLEVRVVRADLGEQVPSADGLGDGLLVLGGHMNAYDDAASPWLPATRELIAAAVERDVPTLGVCLGAQLMGVALGGQVQVAAPPGREAGVVDVSWRPAAAADPVVGPALRASVGLDEVPSEDADSVAITRVVNMHADVVVELPAGATWLASSAMYPFQAFRVGTALAVQFHPEASATTTQAWADQYEEVDSGAVARDLAEAAEPVEEFARALAQAFAAQVSGVAK